MACYRDRWNLRWRETDMTINQAIRILDPETTAEELATIEYYGGQIMRKYMEEQK
jgi:hypothetical protein